MPTQGLEMVGAFYRSESTRIFRPICMGLHLEQYLMLYETEEHNLTAGQLLCRPRIRLRPVSLTLTRYNRQVPKDLGIFIYPAALIDLYGVVRTIK